MMITGRTRHCMGAVGLVLVALLGTAHAQFTEIGAGLTAVDSGSVAWGDYNNDGRLDILLSGWAASGLVTKVYENNGDGTFTDIEAGLTGVAQGSAAWGDFDGDGYLDILLVGRTAGFTAVSKVYRNNGDGTFTDIGAGLTGVFFGSAAWGDYDGDGFPDIVVTGYDNSFNSVATVYRNNGNGTFTDIGAGLTGVSSSSVAWGDFDGDGFPDILLSGWSGSAVVAKVYRNNGNGSFTDIGAGLTGVEFGSLAWGDSNGDGLLDIVLAGYGDGFNPVAKVYRNNGDGSFSESPEAGLIGVGDGSVAWGDYDGDGLLDILLIGWANSGPLSMVYRNNGDGSFTDIEAGLTDVAFGSVAWGDYNNDGNPDILLTGWTGLGPVAEVYRSELEPKESDPDDEEPGDEEPGELSVLERLYNLMDDVAGLQAERRINGGIANAAMNILGNVMRSYDKGQVHAACSQLEGFAGLIQGQLNARKLDPADGGMLIGASNDLGLALGCS